MNNMSSFIKQHNRNILFSSPNSKERSYNCTNKDKCPLASSCLITCIVYRVDVIKQNETHIYYHISDVEFKYWYNNHKNSFRNQDYENKTELSKHIWQLKRNGTEFNLKWSIVTLENLLRISYNDTMMKLSTVIPYLKKIQKLYESRDKLIDLC